MKKLLLILVLLASVRLEAQFVTTFAKNATESQMEGVLYYLPRNVIRLEFTIEEIDYFIGPYAEYASTILGTTDYIKENKSEFNILNVDIQTVSEIDPNAVFYISPEDRGKEPMPNVILNADGMILAVGYDNIPENYSVEANPIIYNDLDVCERVEVSFVEINDSEVELDDDDDDEEEEGRKPRQITKEDKAKVALDKIMNIRNAYFELLSGSQEIPGGEAVKYMAENVKSIENEYVSLFKGKTVRYVYKKVIYVTPENNQASATLSIAKMSKTEGLGDMNGKGETVKIQFDSRNYLANIGSVNSDVINTTQTNKLFYRIPANSSVKIFVGNNVIAQKTLNINQFGLIKTMSVKNNKVLFNTNTGQIISVMKY